MFGRVIVLGFGVAGQMSAATELDFQPLPVTGKLKSAAVAEASGLAVSQTRSGFLWIVNDSGAGPELHLADTDGTDRGRIVVKGAVNTDWEDLASFKLDGKSYLLIADAGDNESKRQNCTLYVVREPQLPDDGKSLSGTVEIEWRIDFTFEGGARDCEAVAVDPEAGKILLLSKRTKPPELYDLPLRPSKKAGEVRIARRLGPTEVNAPAPRLIPFADQPTGMAINADRTVAAVVTYYGVFLFPRKAAESWKEAFARKAAVFKPHHLPQAESVAFSRDSKMLFVVSEGAGSPIQSFKLTEAGGQ